MGLDIAPGLSLPDDTVTQTLAILARRGAGKTYAAKVLAEEMIERGLPVVVLDPVGVWWGLRSTANGSSAGYPVTILGGDHGDLPLDASAGTLVANLVAEEPVAIVLDLSSFGSKAEQRRFATDFAERLYRAKAERRDPLHVMIDEADEFAPQQMRGPENARQLGAFETLVRRGRARGIGVTMITQRPAVLNKNVLTQIECLVVMQVTSPQDRKALGEWVAGHAEPGEQAVVEESLAALKQGDAWFWSPSWLQTLQRVHIRKARTFDSSATPKAGETRREAKVLAKVDLDRLKDGMDRVVKDAERNDPRKLQARIRELERELTRRKPTVEKVVEHVEVPVIDAETRALLAEVRDRLARIEPPSVKREPSPTRLIREAQPVVRERPRRESVGSLGKAERAILTVLAQFPDGRSVSQLAMLTGYSPTASTIGVALSKLRQVGYVAEGNQPARATDDGIAALGPYEQLPTGRALLDYWKSHHLGKAERLILDLLIDNYPQSITHDEIAAATGYSSEASTIGVAMSKLHKLQLATGWRASDDFIDAIR